MNNRRLLFLSDANQQIVSSELKKIDNRKSYIQIANRNKKLCTMLNQVNASQNSRQMIGNTHNDFQPFACIMTEKGDTLVSICVA